MKLRLSLFAVVILTLITSAPFAQDLSNPADYIAAINNAQTEMNQKYMAYMSASAHVRRARKIDKMRQQTLESIQNSRYKTIDLPIYKGTDNSLRQSSIDYIKFCYDVFNDDYAKILNLEDIAEQSYDEMQAYILLQEATTEKIHEANDKMAEAERAFAQKYNVNLIDSKSELGEKLDKSDKLNHYRNQLYLIYFKCYWEDGEIVKALNAGKITEAEQSRNALSRFATEGMAGLDSLKSFDGDPALAISCKEILKFYKDMADKDIPKQMDYFLKKENFEKIKKSFDAKSGSDRTKKDVDAYNEGVKEINNATNTFNNINKKTDSERTDAENKWNNADKAFADAHMPYYKA